MKKMNKLVALLLAAVMVLGLMPSMAAHTHANEYHTHGVEEYPAIELDTPALVEITEGGTSAYFTFTPESTDLYHFYSSVTEENPYADTEAYLYDAEMNQLAYNDQAEWGNDLGISGGNFLITSKLEAGKAYVLTSNLFGSGATGTFYVTLTTAHDYTVEVTKEHTCTEDGIMTFTCSYCGETHDEPIPAAHTWNEENGICTVCGDAYLITGTCGDDLTWALDWNGKLTISGTGAMYDFAQYTTETEAGAPWNNLTEAENPAFITVKSAVVEEGVTSIGSNAFYNCYEMKSVTLPSTVTSIGDYAFANTDILEIVIPEAVTELGVYAFQWCGSLTNVEMPDGLTAIPEGTFNGCGSLKTIGWPANLTTIGKEAFYYLSIENLVLPEGVTTIEERAFRYSYMTSVTLPSSLAFIGEEAFASCWDLQLISFEGNAPASIATSAFYRDTATAYYPENNASWTAENMLDYGGTLTWQAKCANHVYGDWTSYDATCEVGAYRTRTCSVCAWVDTVVLSEPLGHDYVTNVIEPDCATYTYGKTEITCTRCDYYEAKDWIPPECDYVESVVEATCTTDGYTKYTCSKCGNYYTDHYVYATGHVVESWSEPTEATCTEPGVKTGTCTVCNETVTEEATPALGHSWGEWSEPTEATCTEPSIKTAACSVCGETTSEEVSPALGHTWDEENPVENEDGSKTYSCINCDATYRTEGTVLYLGDNTFSIAARTPSASKTFTAEDDGKLTITASDLYYLQPWSGQWGTLAIDWAFREKMFSIAINGTTAEYTVEGSEIEAKLIMSTEVKAGDVVTITLNHDEAKTYYYSYDLKLNMNLALEATHEHDYEIVVTEPTCTEEGYSTYTCACGDTFIDDTKPALGHAFYNGQCTRCDAVQDATFTDVPVGAFCFDAVEWAVEKGITKGIGDGTFLPLRHITRAEVVTFLWRFHGSEIVESDKSFSDVKESDFFYDAVIWAAENGITTGKGNGLFDPAAVCSRAEAITFLWRSEGKPASNATENFDDVNDGDFFAPAVIWAVEKGITEGIDADSFGSANICNRAHIVTFMYRAANAPETEGPEAPEGEKYQVLLKAVGNGTIVCGVTEAAAGEKVTFTAIPDEGYVFTNFQVFDPNGEIDLSGLNLDYGENENEYVFNMVAHDLIVDCVFEANT